MHPLAPWRYANTFPLLIMQHLGTSCKLPTRFTQPAHVTRVTAGAAVISYWVTLRHFSINCLTAIKMTKYYTEQLIFKSKIQNSPSMLKNIHYLTKFLLFNVNLPFYCKFLLLNVNFYIFNVNLTF